MAGFCSMRKYEGMEFGALFKFRSFGPAATCLLMLFASAQELVAPRPDPGGLVPAGMLDW